MRDAIIGASTRRPRDCNVGLCREPFGQRPAPTLTATLIRQNPPSHTEQPGASFLPGRAAIKSPPKGRERLGDHLGRILGIPHATHHVAGDRRVQLAVHPLEPIPPLAA
jgi:hypothetical protein